MAMQLDAAPVAQVKVVFTTTDPDLQLPEANRQMFVPADIKRYGLSSVLNSESMLATAQPIPLDFVVDDGAFLRGSLADYLQDHGLSSETTVTLQYVRSMVPPVFEASFQHDDWVSGVDATEQRLVSASYDGLVRLWNPSGEVVAASANGLGQGHTAGVKTARFVTSQLVASAGLDRTVRLWKVDEEKGILAPKLVLYGHSGSVDSLAVDPVQKRLLSASSDGSVGLWATSKASAPAAPENLLPNASSSSIHKKRKTTAPPPSEIPRRGPLSLIQAHKSAVPASAAVFDPLDRTVAYSAGQDHALCTLDLTTGQVVSSLATSHALLSLCALSSSSSSSSPSNKLLAAGNAGRNVVVIDPRVSVASTAVLTLRGHTNKVVAVAAAPSSSSSSANAHALVSGSHDGTCRIWDLRNSKHSIVHDDVDDNALTDADKTGEAIFVIDRESRSASKKKHIAGEGIKVFDVVWDNTWGIVSGGEDKRLQINRGRDVLAK